MVFILGELFHKSRVGAQDAIASHILLTAFELHLCAQAALQRYFLFSKRIGFGDFEVWGTCVSFFISTKLLFLIGFLPYLCWFFVWLDS